MTTNQVKSVGQILELSSQDLKKRGVLEPKRSAEDLLASILQISRMELYMDLDKPLSEIDLEKMREALKRRRAGEPVDYVLGRVQFFDIELSVTPHVLIPRPETEILLHTAKRVIQNSIESKERESVVLWDICTGSGCMGLGIKNKIPSLEVFLSDISKEAVSIAKKNAEKNSLSVEVLEGDLFAPFSGKKADFIFFNPPYIAKDEYENLHHEVKGFEPKLALLAGESGLELYQRFKDGVVSHLNPGGKVFMEIGHTQGEDIKKIFSSLKNVSCHYEKDWSGKDRFFFLEFE